MKTIIEFDGKFYDNYANLFYDLDKAGKTPCPHWEGDEEYPLEKYILTEIMKLKIQEYQVH